MRSWPDQPLVTKKRTKAVSEMACASTIISTRYRPSGREVDLGHSEENPSQEDYLEGLHNPQNEVCGGQTADTQRGELPGRDPLETRFSKEASEPSFGNCSKRSALAHLTPPEGPDTKSQELFCFALLCSLPVFSFLLQLWGSQRQLSNLSPRRT